MSAAFWSSFWPNFAATIVAVALGIPAGLWLNRQAERSASEARAKELREAEDHRKVEERSRTQEALEQLAPVVQAHQGWFDILGAWKNLNEFHEGSLAELWFVLRGQIEPLHLNDRRLFGDLAVHFERCVRLDELVRLRSSLTLTGVPAQQLLVQKDLEAIETRINNMKSTKDANPSSLADRVATEVQELSRKGALPQRRSVN